MNQSACSPQGFSNRVTSKTIHIRRAWIVLTANMMDMSGCQVITHVDSYVDAIRALGLCLELLSVSLLIAPIRGVLKCISIQ